MTVWSWAWIALLVVPVAVEVWAIVRRGEGDTLSEQVWALRAWLKTKGYAGQVAWAAFVWALVGFFGWLVLHFTFPGAV